MRGNLLLAELGPVLPAACEEAADPSLRWGMNAAMKRNTSIGNGMVNSEKPNAGTRSVKFGTLMGAEMLVEAWSTHSPSGLSQSRSISTEVFPDHRKSCTPPPRISRVVTP